jgi:hypothetical protein
MNVCAQSDRGVKTAETSQSDEMPRIMQTTLLWHRCSMIPESVDVQPIRCLHHHGQGRRDATTNGVDQHWEVYDDTWMALDDEALRAHQDVSAQLCDHIDDWPEITPDILSAQFIKSTELNRQARHLQVNADYGN